MQKAQQTKKPFFSIIIPSLNEEKYLPLLLEDLAQQTFTNFEVIHVDGNSEDKTVAAATAFSKKLTITSTVTTVQNVSHQRNLGIEEANANWLIFMDSDNRLPAFFLEGIKYHLTKNKKIDLFTTLIDVEQYSIANKSIMILTNVLLEILAKVKPSGPGSMIGVRKKLAKKFPFDTTVPLSEDHLFIETLTQDGHTFVCLKDPQYEYSLRRLEQNGTLKTIRMNTTIYLKYFLGLDLEHESREYPMNGGGSYSPKDISKLKQHIDPYHRR